MSNPLAVKLPIFPVSQYTYSVNYFEKMYPLLGKF